MEQSLTIHLRGLGAAAERLRTLDIRRAGADALREAAEDLGARVREVLSHPPGDGHAVPWLRTGALHDSIGCEAGGAEAVVGSTSSVAVDQELGTSTIPPRPFLSTTAAGAADDLVALIAARLKVTLDER